MKRDAEGNQHYSENKPLWQRLAWLVFIWGASVSALAIVAYLLRLLMNAAGMVAP